MKPGLCIVPCGMAKIWDKNPKTGPTQAQFVYTGVFAAACQKYAKAYYENWVILSAKYGFLFPEDIITESYNVSFIKPSTETIEVKALIEQAICKELYDYQEITVLGGKHYVDRMKAVFHRGQRILLPLSDCKGIGYMLQKLTQALEANGIHDLDAVQPQDHELSSNPKRMPTLKTKTGKYTPLYDYLIVQGADELDLTVHQIVEILGFDLPPSAYNHRAWWANDIHHSQAEAWLLASWEVDCVSLPLIKFKKIIE